MTGFSLRRAFNLTNAFILVLGVVFAILFLNVLFKSKRSEVDLRLANESETVRREIDDVLLTAEFTAKSQAEAFALAARLSAPEFERWAQSYSRENLVAEDAHFDVYYGFSGSVARRMFGTPGMVYVVTKDPERIGTPSFNDPATFRIQKFPDAAYLDDPDARWYHGAIEKGGVHTTGLWFDAVYLKRVMISITQAARDPRTGAVLGVAGVDLTAGTFSALLEKFHPSGSGGILLLDEKGRPESVFSARDIPMIGFRYDPAQEASESFQESLPGAPTFSLEPGLREMRGRDGRTYLYESRRLFERPYSVMAYQEKNEAFASAYWITAMMVALVAVFLTVSLFIRQRLTNFVTGNLERVLANIDSNREVFGTVSPTSTLERLDPRGPLELERLGDRLNLLYDRLETAFEEARTARERAEVATRSKSRLLSVMSHEIRTPLNSMLGLADVLLLTPLSSDQARYVRVFQRSGQSLLRILNDILDFSRLEAGKLLIEPGEFDLFDLIYDVDSLMRFDAESKGLRFSVVAPSSSFRLVGDSIRIRQVLLNLLGNAIKFTSQGSVELRVTSLFEAAAGRRRFQFEVADTGIGMSEDARRRLFSEFSQADASINRRYGGTGLGLSISRQIVELLGGRLEVQSEEGRGSVFAFGISLEVKGESKIRYEDAVAGLQRRSPPDPADARGATGSQAIARDARGPSSETHGTSSSRAVAKDERPPKGESSASSEDRVILVVDDDEDNHRLIDAYLRFRKGIRADHALTAREAIERLHRREYALVLMDVQMPDLDGLEATREIRKFQSLGTLGKCPVIMVSANTFPEDRRRALEAGADDHVAKPIQLERFNELLRAWVDA